jgi:hypothetical protein
MIVGKRATTGVDVEADADVVARGCRSFAAGMHPASRTMIIKKERRCWCMITSFPLKDSEKMFRRCSEMFQIYYSLLRSMRGIRLIRQFQSRWIAPLYKKNSDYLHAALRNIGQGRTLLKGHDPDLNNSTLSSLVFTVSITHPYAHKIDPPGKADLIIVLTINSSF